jgi:RNA recognition motif-containing protein
VQFSLILDHIQEVKMKIYVGNLSFDTSESDLRTAFEAHGSVDSVAVITDKYTGRSRGFGFVEMNNAEEAKAAMADMNEKELDGRRLNVNEARAREDNRGGGNGGFKRGY